MHIKLYKLIKLVELYELELCPVNPVWLYTVDRVWMAAFEPRCDGVRT